MGCMGIPRNRIAEVRCAVLVKYSVYRNHLQFTLPHNWCVSLLTLLPHG